MSKQFERVVTVYRLDRMPNSVNGNPRYRLTTDAGEYITSSDHAFVYGIENGFRPRNHWEGRKAWITLTRAGRVSDLEWKDKG